ncbi:MAG: type II secretion system protein, partial [Chloroflexi bacterium]|nr:type II secretion system protein [Chloroflexota bacterium]
MALIHTLVLMMPRLRFNEGRAMAPIYKPKPSTFTRRYGFTLIEMLIVLGILAILVGMAILFLVPTLHRARVTADQVALKSLNDATMVYAIQRGVPSGDIFAGMEEALLSAGAIRAIPQPKEPGASFCWDVATQSWYNSLYEHSAEEPIISSFDFTALNPADFPKTGNWSAGANGFCSNWGLLFIANPREEYTIFTTA